MEAGDRERQDSPAVSTARDLTTIFWNGPTWVGLSGGFGEVRLGRQFVPAAQIGSSSDPWAYDYNVGGSSGFTRGGNAPTMAKRAVPN